MKEYKVIITNKESWINELLGYGWTVDSVTAGHVAAATTGSVSYSKEVHGNFCFILSRTKK